MTFNVYDIGDVARLTAKFTVANVDTDPTSVVLRVRKPSGTTETVSTTLDNVGDYHADVELDEAGRWFYRWIGTGAAEAAGEKVFWVLDNAAELP